MDGASINDPAAVQALLARLQASQAWQDAYAPPPTDSSAPAPASTPAAPPPAPAPTSTPAPTQPSPSVAALLSRLQAPPSARTTIDLTADEDGARDSRSGAPAPIDLTADDGPTRDSGSAPAPIDLTAADDPVRAAPANTSFAQALPLLARLAENPAFMRAVAEMRAEQAALENRLWDARLALVRTHEDKARAAQQTARIAQTPLTAHDAARAEGAFARALAAFDAARVLPTLDALAARQRTRLAALGVPAMAADAPPETQRQIMRVIEGLVGATVP